jgi:alpha-galactosidase
MAHPTGFRQLEVPQRVRVGGRWWLLGCANDFDLDPSLHEPATGTYAMATADPEGMTGWGEPALLLGGRDTPYYAARVVEGPDGPCLLAWRSWDGDVFRGELGDPLALRVTSDGHLTADRPAAAPAPAPPRRQVVAEIAVDGGRALVHEHGWQSWTPAGTYGLADVPRRASGPGRQRMNYRGDVDGPGAEGFQGDGLLAIDPGDGSAIHLFASAPGSDAQATIRTEQRDDRLVVTSDHPVAHRLVAASSIAEALTAYGDEVAATAAARVADPAPTLWCSWYHYSTEVTGADIIENVRAIDEAGLSVDVVQIDDGYQAAIGDWLDPHPRFGPLAPALEAIADGGMASGIWLAPFLVAPRSRLAREHPDWLVGDCDAGWNWGQHMLVLDTTNPEAARHLRGVFRALRDAGISYFKLDFLYAGALPGRRAGDATPLAAYRAGLALVRDAVGDDAVLQGCGAPLLPSIGHVDVMRIGPDIAVQVEPDGGDMSQPSQRAATATSDQRRWMDGRLWRNDPDCLIVRPEVEARERWAEFLFGYPGLRGVSDRIADLDGWGMAVTRAFLDGEVHLPRSGRRR